MSTLAFVNTLASTLSTTSIPMAMMFMTIIMILPGVTLGAYMKAYDTYKSMTSEDQDMLVGMSSVALGLGLFCIFAMTNMNILVLMTLAGVAVKEWSNWSSDIEDQEAEMIMASNYLSFENTLAQMEWRGQLTRTDREILSYADRAPARKIIVRPVAPLVSILDQMDAVYNEVNNTSISSSQVLMGMRMMKK